MEDHPEVLFVCVHNAGRSQMAAGLLAQHANGTVRVRSAGSTPADEINPAVVDAMNEVGVDLSQEYPKPLTDEAVAGVRCGHHDGMRGRLSDLPRQALPRLGPRGPVRQITRGSPVDPR